MVTWKCKEGHVNKLPEVKPFRRFDPLICWTCKLNKSHKEASASARHKLGVRKATHEVHTEDKG